jgi:hypothetical protein
VYRVRWQAGPPDGPVQTGEVTAAPQGRLRLRIPPGGRDAARTSVTIDEA